MRFSAIVSYIDSVGELQDDFYQSSADYRDYLKRSILDHSKLKGVSKDGLEFYDHTSPEDVKFSQYYHVFVIREEHPLFNYFLISSENLIRGISMNPNTVFKIIKEQLYSFGNQFLK